MPPRAPTCFALVVALAACARPSASEDHREDHLGSAPGPIEFLPCALFSHPPSNDTSAECATVDVPLDWDRPAERRATFFVKRIRGSSAGAHKQLWLLNGGPGSAGDFFESLAEELHADDPALDIYLPDHRGTGRSTFLDCPIAWSAGFDRAACAAKLVKAWGEDGLATFSTTTAARDLGEVIARTREANEDVHVYGFSYGTYWAQRYLQLFPTQPTAVTLDGVVQSGLLSAHAFDHQIDRVGKKFLLECVKDPVCGDRLGPDPIAKARDAVAVADRGDCAGLEGVNGSLVRRILQAFVPTEAVRVLVPAIVYRTLRCDAKDVIALQNLIGFLLASGGGAGAAGTTPRYRSDALNHHIVFSEMVRLPIPSRDEVRALMADAVFGEYSPLIADAYDAWPRYPRDSWVGRYPTTPVPLLLLNGTLDAQTPIEMATEVADHYTAASQRLVTLPRAAHGTVPAPPTSCGRIVWRQFLANPTADLDTSCSSTPAPFDFTSSRAGTLLFGTPDVFEGAPEPRPRPQPRELLEPELARVLAELREKLRSEVAVGL